MRNKVTAFVLNSLLALSAPAAAQSYSFTGLFRADNDIARFDFTVGASSTVTLLTYSYAGGTNAAGQTIARGGFDPILSLYNTTTGALVGYNDDGTGSRPDINGIAYDTYFQSSLTPGLYTVFVTQYDDFGPSNFLTGSFLHATDPNFTASFGCSARIFCDVSGSAYNSRDGHWAFDLLGVTGATGPAPPTSAVPEPTTWAMMVGGFFLVGATLRRRRVATRVTFA